jgi:hypothetical protein
VHRGGLLAILFAVALAGCGGGARLDAKVAKRLAVAKATEAPAYWLGPRYDGLDLVYVESGSDALFRSSLYYADCSEFELNSLSPRCHRTIEIDNDVPAPGEISTMGRCIFSTSVHGVTVATFPVNPLDLRVFARGATILVGSRSRADALKAVAALKPLNGHPLAERDVSAVLGTCKAPAPKPRVHLSAKERYERQMKQAFLIESIVEINLNAVDPAAAKPKAVLDDFLSSLETEPALLRNEAYRIERIRPQAAVAGLHARLLEELRAYATVLDRVLADARRDGLDAAAWAADRRELQPQIDAAVSATTRTVQAFRARGYSVFVKPSD